MIRLEIDFFNSDCNGVFSVRSDIARYTMYGIPRDKIQDAINNLPEGLQGIYFLVNNTEAKDKLRYLYIGKTKQGPNRLIDHKSKKDKWNMAYMFLADKEDISLQIADELEAYEISRFSDCQKYNLENNQTNKAVCSSLAKLFSESMEEILNFFGYDANRAFNDSDNNYPDDVFIINRSGTKGLLKVTKDKYILLKGSYISQNIIESQIPNNIMSLREQLLKENKLSSDGIYYKTMEDIEFNSPSNASKFVLGYSDNGWISFKNSDGQTLDESIRK